MLPICLDSDALALSHSTKKFCAHLIFKIEDPVLFIDPPSDETLSSLANTAKQSPSDDDASSSEAQTRESFPATEEITLMPPVPSEPRTFSPCTQDEPPAVDNVSFSMITKLPPSPRRRSQRDLRSLG